MSSSKKINFNVKQIEEDFIKTKKLIEQKYKKWGKKSADRNFLRKNICLSEDQIEADTYENDYLNNVIKDTKEKEIFGSKYIPDINKNELQKK